MITTVASPASRSGAWDIEDDAAANVVRRDNIEE
jgi:hypothetical protein